MSVIKCTGPHGQKICRSLGLNPKHVASLEIIMKAGDVVRVQVEMYVQDDQAESLSCVLKQYSLVEKE